MGISWVFSVLSSRVSSLKPPETFRVLEIAKKLEASGVKVLRFDIGDLNFNTPSHIIDAATEAARRGMVHYVSARGLPEFRRAVADRYRSRYGVEVSPDNVVPTPGAKFGIYAAIAAIADPGDEVVVVSPCWVSYEGIAKFLGVKPVFVRSREDFVPDIEAIKGALSSRTRAIVINSPNNPSGVVYPKEVIKAIAELAEDAGVYLISDEIYDDIVFEGEVVTPLNYMSLERCIVVNGFSKAYAMTGWRLGYVIASKEVIDGVVKVLQNAVSCVPPFIQYAGYIALTSEESRKFISQLVNELRRRRDELYKVLSKFSDVIGVVKPQGAFYYFIDISRFGKSSREFSMYLAEKHGITTVPGAAFGGYDTHIRLSYGSVTVEEIREFEERFERAVCELVKK